MRGDLHFIVSDIFRAIVKGIYIAQLLFASFVTVPCVEVVRSRSSARLNSVFQDIYSRSDCRQEKRQAELFVYQS
jgi:hypothetical protein